LRTRIVFYKAFQIIDMQPLHDHDDDPVFLIIYVAPWTAQPKQNQQKRQSRDPVKNTIQEKQNEPVGLWVGYVCLQ